MTEYGRGPGSEPWHPQDPLYGDPGWDQAHGQHPPHGGWDPHGVPHPGGYDPSHHPHPQAHAPPQQYPPPGAGYPPQQQGYTDPYAGPHGGWDTGTGAAYGYGAPEAAHTGHGGWQGAPTPAQYPGQEHYQAPQPGGYAGQQGQHGYGGYPQAAPYGADHGPYGGEPVAYAPGHGVGHDTWAGQEQGYHAPHPPGSEQYPFPEQAHPSTGIRRRGDRGQPEEPGPDADPETGWDPGPDQGEEDFFRRRDDDETADDGDDDEGGGGRFRRRRGGCACVGAAVVLVGMLGVGAYFGKQFYDSRFGAPEDYSGEGTGEEVQVEIPEGASLVEMGNVLHEAGVVASVAAFTDAAEGEKIQPGYYTLYAEMSAESAVDYLTDPEMLNALVIPEGLRTYEIYEAIDARLGLEEGATEEASDDIELPEWAESDDSDVKDPLEGFLFPARYDIGDETDPGALLQTMVDRAAARYEDMGVEDAAGEHGLDDPRDFITVASLVQAEGITYEDFQQMAEVVYNRLAPDNDVTNRKLEFDSTYNYLKGQSEIVIAEEEVHNDDDPYNTYYHTGLPPGPINSPGEEAVEAALNPTDEGWMFFISIDGETTTFTKTHEEHEELREEFNERLDISGTS